MVENFPPLLLFVTISTVNLTISGNLGAKSMTAEKKCLIKKRIKIADLGINPHEFFFCLFVFLVFFIEQFCILQEFLFHFLAIFNVLFAFGYLKCNKC